MIPACQTLPVTPEVRDVQSVVHHLLGLLLTVLLYRLWSIYSQSC